MKTKRLFVLLLCTLLVVLSLAGCASPKLLNSKALKNVTIERVFDNETLILKRVDNNYLYQLGDDVKTIAKYQNVAFEYTSTVKHNSSENEEDITTKVFTPTVTTDTTYKYFELLENLEKGSLDNLVGNELISQYLTGIKVEPQTDAKEAYDRNLLTVSKIDLEQSSKKPSKVTISFSYAGTDYQVVYNFKDYGSTAISMPVETTEDKDYKAALSDKNAIVTFNFKGYGKIKVQLFQDFDDTNVVNYFLYLVKKGFYKKVFVNAQPSMSNGVVFGESSETLKKTVSADTTLTYKNTRGTLSMMLTDSSASTTKLVFNTTTNTSYDSNGYTPIGGIVDGFTVLDSLMGLTADEYAKVKVTVSVKYNGYKYSQPDFD